MDRLPTHVLPTRRRRILWGVAICRQVYDNLTSTGRFVLGLCEEYAEDVEVCQVDGSFPNHRTQLLLSIRPRFSTATGVELASAFADNSVVSLASHLHSPKLHRVAAESSLASIAEGCQRSMLAALTNLDHNGVWELWHQFQSDQAQFQPLAAFVLKQNALLNCIGPVATASGPSFRQALTANDNAARRIAERIYQEQDFDALPVLADALEEGGCNPHLLFIQHLRDPRPHGRGCWSLDAVLGKEL